MGWLSLVIGALVVANPSPAPENPSLLLDAQTASPVAAPTPQGDGQRLDERLIRLHFAHEAWAYYGQPVPGGGTLLPDAWVNPAPINNAGQIAFYARVAGNDRNQGIFVADESGIRAVATGCGGAGGEGDPGPCGDPTPAGGTFGGMFGGSFIVPAINDNGDVLFISDVFMSYTPRGLFLYRAAQNDIVKVAAINDPSPLGLHFTAVGPGSVNSAGQVVFFATTDLNELPDILKYDNGTLSVVAAMGQPTPLSGTYEAFSLEALGFSDNTWIPTGTVPDIDEAGDIAFYASLTGSIFQNAIFVLPHDGHVTWWLRQGQGTPLGGQYTDFWAPSINNSGQLAVLADIHLSSGNTSAWIVGGPGHWRKALAFYDALDNGIVWILAVSRNPVNVLDDCGNLGVWCQINVSGSLYYRMLISGSDGVLNVVAREGDATPLGGTFGRMQGWPSMNSFGQIGFGAAVQGGPASTAQFVSEIGNRPGDANDDGLLGSADWLELPAGLAGPDHCTATFNRRVFDFDGDTDVDLRDVAGFQAGYGT